MIKKIVAAEKWSKEERQSGKPQLSLHKGDLSGTTNTRLDSVCW